MCQVTFELTPGEQCVDQPELVVSVVISTYNRSDALEPTLRALNAQTLPTTCYEVLVVDDGSTDATPDTLSRQRMECALRVMRHPENRGVSAGRNTAIREARGKYLVLVSDDVIVPPDFLEIHVQTLERFPGWWVVGGMRQLDDATATPFGRYLDRLEQRIEEGRKVEALGSGLWELRMPTARNLSLPRADLERTGLFDERFRISCEDQDLAHRAREAGIRFLYNTNITCLHNDHVAQLDRCCRQQQRFAHDGALFCFKHEAIHGRAALVRLNGHLRRGDAPLVALRKIAKAVLSTGFATRATEQLIRAAQAVRVPEPVLFRLYQYLIGLYIFRGWRDGLRTLAEQREHACDLGHHSHV